MESASEIDQSLLFFWIYRALSRKLKPIRTSRRDYFPAYDLSHVLKLLDADELVEGGDSKTNGLVFQEIARQWNQIVAMLQQGTNYPAVKRLQKDLRQEQLYLRNQVLTRAKAREREGIKGRTVDSEKDASRRAEGMSVQNGTTLRSSIPNGFTLDSMERTLFALSLRSAVLDTALHLFEVYAETKTWKEWASVGEHDLSRPFFQYLLAVKKVVEHPEHSVGLSSSNSIYGKVDELNKPYKANTVARSIRENFDDQFHREKPDGLKEWREFFESDAYQRHGPEGLVRQDNLL